MSTIKECNSCDGKGIIKNNVCKKCSGEGMIYPEPDEKDIESLLYLLEDLNEEDDY